MTTAATRSAAEAFTLAFAMLKDGMHVRLGREDGVWTVSYWSRG